MSSLLAARTDELSRAGNPCLFHGARYDEETGFYYLRNRFYDPRTGRFLQRDPVWDPQNFGGWYAFVGNGPASRSDPLGLNDQERINKAAHQINRATQSFIRAVQDPNPDPELIRRKTRMMEAYMSPGGVLHAGIEGGFAFRKELWRRMDIEEQARKDEQIRRAARDRLQQKLVEKRLGGDPQSPDPAEQSPTQSQVECPGLSQLFGEISDREELLAEISQAFRAVDWDEWAPGSGAGLERVLETIMKNRPKEALDRVFPDIFGADPDSLTNRQLEPILRFLRLNEDDSTPLPYSPPGQPQCPPQGVDTSDWSKSPAAKPMPAPPQTGGLPVP